MWNNLRFNDFRRKRNYGFEQGKSKKRPYVESNEILAMITYICNQKKTIDEQIPLIVAQVEAEPIYYKQVEEICSNLNRHLEYFYRKRIKSIKIFGSAVTKLALKNSDVDIFVDFGDDLPQLPQNFVKSLRKHISKNRLFRRPVAIIARVPIVQFVHSTTGIMCDLSFLNGLGVANSNLIKFFLSIDKRTKPLMLILKCLFKEEGLIGPNAITSYALVILIIFFLQQLEQPLIPAISYLQEQATVKETIADWDVSVSTDYDILLPITNSLSITELFKKFFRFYATFEFGLYVISSFTAKTYLKPEFAKVESLAKEFQCYKENVKKGLKPVFECNKCMCVQGPFNHSHNITRNVSQKILQQFQKLCYDKSHICPEEFNEDKSKDYKSLYFVNLFTKNNEGLKNFKVSENVDVNIYIGHYTTSGNSKLTENEIRHEWSESILKNVKQILTKVMKCNINISLDEENNSPEKSSLNGEILQVLNCELCYFELVTKKRNYVRHEFKFASCRTPLDQEEAITNFMLDKFIKEEHKVSLKFDMTCLLKKEPTSFCMQLSCKEQGKAEKNFVNQIFQFIKVSFPKWID